MTHSAPSALSVAHSSFPHKAALLKRMLNFFSEQNDYNLFREYYEIAECQQSSRQVAKKRKYIFTRLTFSF
jgi:hypothetical protein